METIRGVKGFDKDLKCKGFQYEIGQAYSIEETPKACHRGFHFCTTLKQAMVYYPNKDGNRYCWVESQGDIDLGPDKVATNKLKILNEFTIEEICAELEGISLLTIRDAYNAGGIIGGSLGLKLQGFDLGRPIKDIDFIFPDPSKVSEVFKSFETAQLGSVIIENNDRKTSDHRAFYDKRYNKTYDVFIKDVSFKEVDFYGTKIRVCDALKIWGEKLNYAFGGSIKHANDFNKFRHRLSFELLLRDNQIKDTVLLPF
jgi:hypothetical protein